jgi:N-acetylglutamate synthase-like GNAT family acetyltransferase
VTINTPDFFTRAKIFEDSKVYVMTHRKKIVGAAACAVHPAMVNGVETKIGYEFQAFVDPHFRGKGIAGKLHAAREQYLKERGAVLAYALILDENVASMRYIEKEGFTQHRMLVMPSIMVNREMEVDSKVKVRPITSKDLEAVAELVNRTWEGYELYEPLTADSLSHLVMRTPIYTYNDILVLEENRKIMACLGFWDWSRVFKIIVKSLSFKVRAMSVFMDIASRFTGIPRGPRVGETLKQIVLTPIGYRDIEHLSVLLRQVNNRAFAMGIQQIDCVCEKDHPMLESTKGFIRIDSGIHVYIKPLKEDVHLSDGPVFMNGLAL